MNFITAFIKGLGAAFGIAQKDFGFWGLESIFGSESGARLVAPLASLSLRGWAIGYYRVWLVWRGLGPSVVGLVFLFLSRIWGGSETLSPWSDRKPALPERLTR